MDDDKYDDFRDLIIWKMCRDIRKKVWDLCKTFPKEEKYKLTDQMVRSSRSAPSCIAEGYGRFHFQENIQFCRQSRGSLFELIDHYVTALECEYIDRKTLERMVKDIKSSIKSINGYIRYLEKRKKDS